MGKIFYLMGKSASGKDTIFRSLAEDETLGLSLVTLYTTRPMRANEKEGREYFFRDEAFLDAERKAGRVIECRTYQTVYGPWSYFTLDDGQIDPAARNHLMIGTPEAYGLMRAYAGGKLIPYLVPVYIEVEDGERLMRAISRERQQEKPGYQELCRRFLADSVDFAEEKLAALGIEKRYDNEDLEACIREIREMILTAGQAEAGRACF